MTIRWACTILLNIILGGAVVCLQPRRLRWLGVSQAVVLAATLWTICSLHWPALDPDDAVWGALLKAETFFECVAAGHMILLGDALLGAVGCLMGTHLYLLMLEHHEWLDYGDNVAGVFILAVRHNVNLLMIVAQLFAVYYVRERHCALRTSHERSTAA